jgi:hypothetical protein
MTEAIPKVQRHLAANRDAPYEIWTKWAGSIAKRVCPRYISLNWLPSTRRVPSKMGHIAQLPASINQRWDLSQRKPSIVEPTPRGITIALQFI